VSVQAAGPLSRWVSALAAELGLPPDVVDVRAVLDLAREAAHQVDRPAAPVTAFLAGYALGRMTDGAPAPSPQAVEDVFGRAHRLAAGWSPAGPEA
jgi:hypothetical protein